MAKGKSEDLGRLFLRLAVGVILLFHGISKVIHGVEWIRGPLEAVGLPGYLAYGVYLGEIVAPVLILLGSWTRLAALVTAFDMFMAIFLVLRHQVFATKAMGGGWGIELEMLLLLSSLALFFLGGGKIGLARGRGPWD